MRRIAVMLFLLAPSVAAAQADSGTVRITYELLKGDVRTAAYDQTLPAGMFPYVPVGTRPTPGRKVPRPLRLQGCAQNAKRGTYNVEFFAALGPEGFTVGGPTRTIVSLQIGGYPWNRSERYRGAGTYPQDFILSPKQTAKSWQFRPEGKQMWDQIMKISTGGAAVTVNADERSGTFVLGPYTDTRKQSWTARGTFTCSRLMVPKGL